MAELAKNTKEQLETIRAAEKQWEKEREWPIFKVVLTGDEVEYAARPGMNMDDDGNPQPWNAIARCEVTLRAPHEDYAKMLALRANADSGYHTVESVEGVKE